MTWSLTQSDHHPFHGNYLLQLDKHSHRYSNCRKDCDGFQRFWSVVLQSGFFNERYSYRLLPHFCRACSKKYRPRFEYVTLMIKPCGGRSRGSWFSQWSPKYYETRNSDYVSRHLKNQRGSLQFFSSLASHTLHRERNGLVTPQLPSSHRGMQLSNIAVR